MKVFIGSDHAGFELKRKLIPFIVSLGFAVEDKGAFSLDEGDDYPDFIVPVARAVAENNGAWGIILGGSGQGEAIAANRMRGARAAVYYGGDESIACLSREHNDANILSLGARFVNEEEARRVVKVWLETPFSGDERHARRIRKIDSSQ